MANTFQWKDKIFNIGDIVKVDYIIKEKGKERTQPFQGRIIAIKGRGPEEKTFTIRKIGADNIGVERIIPVQSPWISNMNLLSKPKKKVKRSKLYYLREMEGKKANL